jgi:hypothetical protein
VPVPVPETAPRRGAPSSEAETGLEMEGVSRQKLVPENVNVSAQAPI